MRARTARWVSWLLLPGAGAALLAGGFRYLRAENQQQQANSDLLEELYWRPDTVFERHDSVFVVSRKLDTVAVETGIFTYLKYYYPVEMSTPIYQYAKRAAALARAGRTPEAHAEYRELIDWYRENCQPYQGFSDMNNLLTVGTPDAILCAHAYRQLGQVDEALAVLRPWLAHAETIGTKVHHLYLLRYGRARVLREVATAPRTLHRTAHDTGSTPEYDAWVIDVFGAEIGVGDINQHPTVAQVAAELPQQGFCQVLR